MGEEIEKLILQQVKNRSEVFEPVLFDLSNESERKNLLAFFEEKKINRVSDDYEGQMREYFAVQNPTLVFAPEFEEKFQEHLTILRNERPLSQQGGWAYFPWNSSLVHILDEEPFYQVRINRNRNLITEAEQSKYYNSTIGIAGLSVGNSVALAIVLQGGAKHMKIADLDKLALSNINRIRSSVEDLDTQKTIMTARQIYELNPYAKVNVFSDGLHRQNISDFFSGLNIVIDEVDNLAVKHLIREHARKNKIPVLMGADDGDNAVIDIERYDLDPNLQFFHGRMGEVTYEQLAGLNKFETGRMIAKYVGAENVPKRMQESLGEMGKTIVSWPQLGGAALLNGSALAYCARKILIGENIESNRALISLDEELIPDYHSDASKALRAKHFKDFTKKFKL